MPVRASAVFWETESLSAGRAKSPSPARTRPHFIIGAQKNTSAKLATVHGEVHAIACQPRSKRTCLWSSWVVHEGAEAAAETCGCHGDGGPIEGHGRSVRRFERRGYLGNTRAYVLFG